MRRISMAAVVAAGGSLAVAGPAAANTNDITSLTASQATAAADSVTVQGSITCAADLQYGVIVKVTQGSAEAVGAFGPNTNVPGGVVDDQTCGTTAKQFDVTVQANQGSAAFGSGALSGILQAGTSANNGTRGPGPFIGDLEQVNVTGSGGGGGGGGSPIDDLLEQCAATPGAPICEQLAGLIEMCQDTPAAPACDIFGGTIPEIPGLPGLPGGGGGGGLPTLPGLGGGGGGLGGLLGL